MHEERSVQPGAFVVTVAAFLALTSGPVFRVRTWWGYEDPLADDTFVVVLHAAFGVLAVGWLLAAGRWRRLDRTALVVASSLVGWLLLTSVWSLDRADTARQALQIASALAVGAAAVTALGWRWLRVALWTALHVGLAWSVVAIYFDRPGTLDRNGDWAGVYFNRNSLALYAALGVLTGGFVAADVLTARRTTWTWPLVAGLALAAIIDVRLIAGSDALTPLAALALAAAAVLVAWVGRGLVGRGASAVRLATWAGVVFAVVGALAWTTRSAWLDRFGRDSDLTGRSDLWTVALDWAWRRPAHGFGYLAVWGDSAFLDDVLAVRGTLLGSAHNSFVEVFLGAGLIGLVLLVAYTVVLYRNTAVTALTGAVPGALFPLAVLVYLLVENLAETLLVGNQLAVALLGALVAVTPRR